MTCLPFGVPCKALLEGLLPCLIVPCFLLFGFHLLEACFSDQGGVEGKEAVIRLYCMREESILNKNILK